MVEHQVEDYKSLLAALNKEDSWLRFKRRWLMGLPPSDADKKRIKKLDPLSDKSIPEALLREDDEYYGNIKNLVERVLDASTIPEAMRREDDAFREPRKRGRKRGRKKSRVSVAATSGKEHDLCPERSRKRMRVSVATTSGKKHDLWPENLSIDLVGMTKEDLCSLSELVTEGLIEFEKTKPKMKRIIKKHLPSYLDCKDRDLLETRKDQISSLLNPEKLFENCTSVHNLSIDLDGMTKEDLCSLSELVTEGLIEFEKNKQKMKRIIQRHLPSYLDCENRDLLETRKDQISSLLNQEKLFENCTRVQNLSIDLDGMTKQHLCSLSELVTEGLMEFEKTKEKMKQIIKKHLPSYLDCENRDLLETRKDQISSLLKPERLFENCTRAENLSIDLDGMTKEDLCSLSELVTEGLIEFEKTRQIMKYIIRKHLPSYLDCENRNLLETRKDQISSLLNPPCNCEDLCSSSSTPEDDFCGCAIRVIDMLEELPHPTLEAMYRRLKRKTDSKARRKLDCLAGVRLHCTKMVRQLDETNPTPPESLVEALSMAGVTFKLLLGHTHVTEFKRFSPEVEALQYSIAKAIRRMDNSINSKVIDEAREKVLILSEREVGISKKSLRCVARYQLIVYLVECGYMESIPEALVEILNGINNPKSRSSKPPSSKPPPSKPPPSNSKPPSSKPPPSKPPPSNSKPPSSKPPPSKPPLLKPPSSKSCSSKPPLSKPPSLKPPSSKSCSSAWGSTLKIDVEEEVELLLCLSAQIKQVIWDNNLLSEEEFDRDFASAYMEEPEEDGDEEILASRDFKLEDSNEEYNSETESIGETKPDQSPYDSPNVKKEPVVGIDEETDPFWSSDAFSRNQGFNRNRPTLLDDSELKTNHKNTPEGHTQGRFGKNKYLSIQRACDETAMTMYRAIDGILKELTKG